MEINAELQAVLIEFPREVVEDLVVTIEAVTWNAAGRSELRHSADQDDGQATVRQSS